MKVLTPEEFERLLSSDDGKEGIKEYPKDDAILIKLAKQGLLIETLEIAEDGIEWIISNITDKGKLALRCHAAYLNSVSV